MKIASVEAIPLTEPIVMSHVIVAQSDNVLVKITNEDGLVGWGESVEATDLTGETQHSIVPALPIPTGPGLGVTPDLVGG